VSVNCGGGGWWARTAGRGPTRACGGGRVRTARLGRRGHTAARTRLCRNHIEMWDWNQWSGFGSGKVALASRPGAHAYAGIYPTPGRQFIRPYTPREIADPKISGGLIHPPPPLTHLRAAHPHRFVLSSSGTTSEDLRGKRMSQLLVWFGGFERLAHAADAGMVRCSCSWVG
jgi:hypothetical protein